MKPEELREILEKHRKWLNDEDGGCRADLCCANLRDAAILDELLASIAPICCPEYGAFIGWKKCNNDLIVKLRVEEDAKR